MRYTPFHLGFIRSNFAASKGYCTDMRPISSFLLSSALLMGCTPGNTSAQDKDLDCPELSAAFVTDHKSALADTTGRFFHDYPTPTPLTCELLGMLQEELKDDSVHYHFEHLHQRYGIRGPVQPSCSSSGITTSHWPWRSPRTGTPIRASKR